jgi:long-chain acyl-CoA synthetase
MVAPEMTAPRLHDLFLASVERHPDKAAFVRRGESVSYRELEARCAGFAAALAAAGIGRGDRVALLLDGDSDYLVAFYGALMAGAAPVPLCPDTRTEPLVHALSHSGARALVLDAANLRWLDGHAAAVPELRLLFVRGEGALKEPGHLSTLSYAEAVTTPRAPDGGALDTDLAALIYTSGTTGRPKGVMLSHRNLSANVRSIVAYLALGSEDTIGMVLPFYYVYGNSVLHTHLAAGGTIAQAGTLTFVSQVVEGLAKFRCTGFSGVPATFARLLSFSSWDKHDLSALRYMTQAGAAMTPALIERLSATFPRVKVFVMYGQTEAAARLSYVPPERLVDKLGSAGKAIPGVTLSVCDAEGRELPRGELGEVVARGDNVMLGYLNDPEATARTLRPEGLRTGDVGYMDDDGYLFLKGRESELIKSGGHRISPYEIEQALARAPGVHECAVVGLPDDMLGEAIAAYVVPEAGVTLTKKLLLDACFEALPKFKMPSLLFAIDELPRGATGKLKRKELVAWHAQGKGTKL